MLNIYSVSTIYEAVDRVIHCLATETRHSTMHNPNVRVDFSLGCFAMSRVMILGQVDDVYRPAVVMLAPIHLHHSGNMTTVVGVAYSVVYVDVLFSRSVAPYLEGIWVKLESRNDVASVNQDEETQHEVYMYRIERSDATFVEGAKEAESRSRRNHRYDVTLDTLGPNHGYAIKIYASREYDKQYETNGPLYSSLFTAATVLITSLMFFWYDYSVTRSQLQKELVMETRRLFVRYMDAHIYIYSNSVFVFLLSWIIS